MNRADFQQTGGFPLETDTLDFMQESYTQLQHLASSIAGDTPSIISGCNVVGSTVSNGWVVINGELLPFEGGALGAKVGIVETVESKVFEDGAPKPVYKRRKAVFSLSGATNWGDFKRVQPLVKYAKEEMLVQVPAEIELHTEYLNFSSPRTLRAAIRGTTIDCIVEFSVSTMSTDTDYIRTKIIMPYKIDSNRPLLIYAFMTRSDSERVYMISNPFYIRVDENGDIVFSLDNTYLIPPGNGQGYFIHLTGMLKDE